MSTQHYDVLIVGCGIAGLSAAIKLLEGDLSVAVITREKGPENSNTFWAQGGIIYSPENDQKLSSDIELASSDTSNPEVVKVLTKRSAAILKEILVDKAKTEFAREQSGEFKFTLEAAHSRARILYHGDMTGKTIELSLLRYLRKIEKEKKLSKLTFLTAHTAIDLITPLHHGKSIQDRYTPNRVVGVYALNREKNEVVKILAKKTILASGGTGALYLHHTNSEGARGDGHAMAKRAGATLINMEFIQFHPTAFYDRSHHRRFLISESVRGEGGRLLNNKAEAFMKHYDSREELASRDVVARAIIDEMQKTSHACVYLDITHKNENELRERFPAIFEYLMKNGINMAKDLIPVVPAAHYSCGGIKTDLVGKTDLENLYAVGEVACNGLHGANRLASTSLLEGLTFGYIAGEEISFALGKDSPHYSAERIKDWMPGTADYDHTLVLQDWQTLKQTMWNYVGIKRTSNKLKRGEAMLRELYEEIQKFYRHAHLEDELIGLRNAVETGMLILSASIRNTDSVGCFYRID